MPLNDDGSLSLRVEISKIYSEKHHFYGMFEGKNH